MPVYLVIGSREQPESSRIPLALRSKHEKRARFTPNARLTGLNFSRFWKTWFLEVPSIVPELSSQGLKLFG
jgi:hypothetical protein